MTIDRHTATAFVRPVDVALDVNRFSVALDEAWTPHIQNKNIKHPARYPPNPRLQTIGNDSLCQPLTTLIGGCASSHSQAVTGAYSRETENFPSCE